MTRFGATLIQLAGCPGLCLYGFGSGNARADFESTAQSPFIVASIIRTKRFDSWMVIVETCTKIIISNNAAQVHAAIHIQALDPTRRPAKQKD